MGPRVVAIVPHTHWDREWYAPYHVFRLRLVELLDRFLPQLEEDLAYSRFLLDGQMAVVDDYLEARPEGEPVLRRLAVSGRLAMGPWYTLPDEFLVSGETHVRNLQMGLARAGAFAGAMEVGYLPDMFGHIAQMPQLLSHFGLRHAVVWRGVPKSVDRTAFWWSSPDGSTVRAQYLARGGYGNGAAIPDDAEALVLRVASHEAELGSMLAGGILLLNGTDHQVPQPWLGRVVAEANAIQGDYRFVVSSLSEYLDSPAAATDGLPAWTGELRSGARANLLMGVASNRVDVKQQAARAERALEQLAEPLCALFLPARRWPETLLGLAWREVVRNAAHDSICACSHDEVVAAVTGRYSEARQIAEGLCEMALTELGSSFSTRGPVVVNPSPHPRAGVVEVVLSHDKPVPGTQMLEERPGGAGAIRLVRSSDVAALLGQIRGQQYDDTLFVAGLDVDEDEEGPLIVVRLATSPVEGLDVAAVRRDLYTRLGTSDREWFRLRIHWPPVQRLLVRVEGVPGYGWHAWSEAETPAPGGLRVDRTRMSNDLVTVVVDEQHGTFAVGDLTGLGRLVESGDAGDTYNYCPPASDVVVDCPDAVTVDVIEAGPLRGIVEVTSTYTWPERLDEVRGCRMGSRVTVVRTRLQLHAGDPLVRVSTTFDNQSRDHRLRALFPLPQPVTSSRAECAFATVERGLEPEGGPSEAPMATYPSRRFVCAGGLTVVHEGLLEYEVVQDGRALALTLLRCTGWLSRGPMATRPEPAGPLLPLQGSQLQGPIEVRYGVHVGPANPYHLVDDAFLPLQVVAAPGGGARPPQGRALAIEGAQVSALRRTAGGGLEIRVFNPAATPTEVRLDGRSGWLVDLRGRPLEPFDGSFELGPWRIATARLDALARDG